MKNKFIKSLSKELKPCPFCGCENPEPDILLNQNVGEKSQYYHVKVFCPKCFVGVGMGSIGGGCGSDFVISHLLTTWNKRNGVLDKTVVEHDKIVSRLTKMMEKCL